MLNRKLYLTPLTVLAGAALVFGAVACGGGGDDDDDNGDGDNGGGQTTFELTMNETDGNVFLLDGEKNPTLKVDAGAEITVNLINDGSAIHNMRFGGEDKTYNNADDAVSDPDFVSPGKPAVLVFTAPEKAGTYVYQCDIHPTDMLGEIEVED